MTISSKVIMAHLRILILIVIFTNCLPSTIENNRTDFNRTDDVMLNVTDIPAVLNVTEIAQVNSTLEANKTEMTNATEQVENLIPSMNQSTYLCDCDVTVDSCDITCCCDPDCSESDREAFTDCTEVPIYDPRYCYKENFVVRNNSPYKMVQTSDNMFCIYKDNFKQRFEYKEPSVVASVPQFQAFMKKYSHISETTTSNFLVESYRIGSPVYIKYASGHIGYFSLPRSLPMGVCNHNNPMSYMTSQSFTCYQHLTNLRDDCTNNVWLSGFTYLENFEVARTPASFRNEENSTDIGFLNLTSRLCPSIVDSITGPCVQVDPADILKPKYHKNKCHNAVSKVLYVVEHNGTKGIVGIEAHLTFGTIDSSVQNWPQNFGVTFKWTSKENVTEEQQLQPPVFVRSGNPGYHMGAPVIAGKLITRRDDGDSDTPIRKTAVEVSRDPLTWLTVISPSESGRCIWKTGSAASGIERLPVRFGRDLKTGCQLIVSLVNITNACHFIQNVALDALESWRSLDVVAAYGNPNVENPGEWVPILRENQPSSTHRSVNSDMGCTNIVRKLDVHIVYANIGDFGNPQPKIIGVRFRYGLAEKLELRCYGHFCRPGSEEMTQSFEVTTSVVFVDASEPAVPMYAVPPSIDVQLPYDFFYPFHDSSTASHASIDDFVLCVTLILFLSVTAA